MEMEEGRVKKSSHCAWQIHYHIVFPVKYRKALLDEDVESTLDLIAIDWQHGRQGLLPRYFGHSHQRELIGRGRPISDRAGKAWRGGICDEAVKLFIGIQLV